MFQYKFEVMYHNKFHVVSHCNLKYIIVSDTSESFFKYRYHRITKINEDGRNNYHEERIGRLNETLKLVLPLLDLSRRIQQIDIVLENLLTPKNHTETINHQRVRTHTNKD